jgi:Ca2+-binding RTX toxin-like protein
MKRIMAGLATLAAVCMMMFAGTTAANAGTPSGDCNTGRGVNFCPNPPVPTPQGFNLILGSRGNDTIFGTHGADAIFGLAGDDRLITNGGSDTLFGGRGNDTLVDNQPAFFGNVATLRGGSGIDLCIGTTNDVFRSCETVIVLP